MKIAHITATFPPYRGGTGNVCHHNARELARRGHEVHVFTATHGGAAACEQLDGFTVHRLRPLVQVGNAPLLPGLLRALRGFDLLHLHYPFFGGEITTLAARLTRTPLVVTYHQDVFLSGLIGALATTMRHTVGRMTLRAATRLLFTSLDYGRATYVRPMVRGREHAIAELPNGVDTRRFSLADDAVAVRAQYGLSATDHVALLVAGLDRAHVFKGVSVLLEAVAQLPESFKALIVGDGDMRPQYQQTAAALGIADRVVFAGRVPDAALPGCYRAADVTVLPSTTMGEAFGLVLVESLACGTSVIASDLPGVRTVVQHGSDGLLVKPGDTAALAGALRQMLADDVTRRAMGQRGRARVAARYAWESIGVQLEDIYQQVLNESLVAPAEYARGKQ